MLLSRLASLLIRRAERRLGVSLDYVHAIARRDTGLLLRYNKIFAFLDPNRKVPPLAYHAARLRGAMAADCGTCVEAELNLAVQAGLDPVLVEGLLTGDYAELPPEIAAVARLADAVCAGREDDPEARETVLLAFGEAGLIEIAFAMNGAAMLPGVKRAMGYATACDMALLRRQAGFGG